MKRSEINRIISRGIQFLKQMNYKAPPFVYWTPGQWADKGHEYDEIRDCMLGWDVTDFGSGEFDKTGLLVITVRNGIKGQRYLSKNICGEMPDCAGPAGDANALSLP